MPLVRGGLGPADHVSAAVELAPLLLSGGSGRRIGAPLLGMAEPSACLALVLDSEGHVYILLMLVAHGDLSLKGPFGHVYRLALLRCLTD